MGCSEGRWSPAWAAGAGPAGHWSVARLHVVLRRLCRSLDREMGSIARSHDAIDVPNFGSVVIPPRAPFREATRAPRVGHGRSDGLSSAHAPPGWRICLRAAARRARASARQRCAQALLHRHGRPCLCAQDPARRCAQLVRARVSQLKIVDVRSAVYVPCTRHVHTHAHNAVRVARLGRVRATACCGCGCACVACALWRVRCG